MHRTKPCQRVPVEQSFVKEFLWNNHKKKQMDYQLPEVEFNEIDGGERKIILIQVTTPGEEIDVSTFIKKNLIAYFGGLSLFASDDDLVSFCNSIGASWKDKKLNLRKRFFRCAKHTGVQ